MNANTAPACALCGFHPAHRGSLCHWCRTAEIVEGESMNAPEFDPTLLDEATRAASYADRRKNATYEGLALAVLAVAAPHLRAQGVALQRTAAKDISAVECRCAGCAEHVRAVRAARDAVARIEGGSR